MGGCAGAVGRRCAGQRRNCCSHWLPGADAPGTVHPAPAAGANFGRCDAATGTRTHGCANPRCWRRMGFGSACTAVSITRSSLNTTSPKCTFRSCRASSCHRCQLPGGNSSPSLRCWQDSTYRWRSPRFRPARPADSGQLSSGRPADGTPRLHRPQRTCAAAHHAAAAPTVHDAARHPTWPPHIATTLGMPQWCPGCLARQLQACCCFCFWTIPHRSAGEWQLSRANMADWWSAGGWSC